MLLLAFAASVLAFCGPTHGGRTGPTALAVLIDSSASMRASGAWREARARLAERLAALPPGVDVRVASCGAEVDLLSGTPDEILAALPQDPTGAGAVDLEQLGKELAGSQDTTAVWTLTDGLGPTLPPRDGALTLVGAEVDNVGLVAMQLDDRWPLPEVQVEVTVQSFAAASVSVRLAVAGGVEQAAPQQLELPPGGARRVELSLRRAGGGELRLFLDGHRDAFAADDELRALLPEPPAPDVAVRVDDEGGPWLGVAAAALAAEIGGAVVPGDAGSSAAFLLVDGMAQPREAEARRALTFGTRLGTQPAVPADFGGQARVVDWDRDDPITRGLDFSELEVTHCLREAALGGGRVLIAGELEDGTAVPLLVARQAEDGASCHAAFRLADSNLPLLAAFPQLLRRCFAYSYGTAAVAVPGPGNLVDPDESELRRRTTARDRPLPAFGREGASLVVPLLLLALAAMALRVYL